jgi:hypothetical protein
VKITRDLVLNVLSFTVGSVLYELLHQRGERRRASAVESAPHDHGAPAA